VFRSFYCSVSPNVTYQVLRGAIVALGTEVRLPLLDHPVIARKMAIMTMAAKAFLDRTGMLTRGLAELYRGPGTMVREGGVPANFP
jgi:hypothetical protein